MSGLTIFRPACMTRSRRAGFASAMSSPMIVPYARSIRMS
jgi:hypothetical protein